MPILLRDILLGIAAFAAMELIAALAHRHIYHRIGWSFHASHHQPRTGIFERNDAFPAFFASIAIAMMFASLNVAALRMLFPISIGVSVYGVTYFVIHDLIIHRRAGRIRIRSPYLRRVYAAHVMHHRHGTEPYGLLYIPRAMRKSRAGRRSAPVNEAIQKDSRKTNA